MRKRAPLTQKEVRHLRHCYRRGDKIPDILKRFDITKRTMYNHLGSQRRGYLRRYATKEVLDVIATRNMRGFSDSSTAAHLGISEDTVSRYRESLNLPKVPRKMQRKKEAWSS